jgi:glutaconate CoA-transferase subunit B
MDKFGNINTTLIGGTYDAPRVRLPGAGGAPEIATAAREVTIILKHHARALVEKLDFVTSSGYVDEPNHKGHAAPRGRGPTTVITDLGVMNSDPATRELVLTALHPGIALEQVQRATGWKLKVASKLEVTSKPSACELTTLRDLYARTAAAHGTADRGE